MIYGPTVSWMLTFESLSVILIHLVVGGKEFCFRNSTTAVWLLRAAQCSKVGTLGGLPW